LGYLTLEEEKMRHYVADFETTTTAPTRVWAWGVCEIGKTRVTWDNNIDTFFEWIKGKWKKEANKVIYFHNLRWDGAFLFQWLFANGYTYDEDKNDHTFNCLISDTGQFYQIEVIFKRYDRKYHKVTFLDSFKKLPFSAKKIAKDFKLDVTKGEIDYDKERPIGYKLTEEEADYLVRDIQIIAKALDIQYKQGLTKMTIGSDALNNYKNVIGKKIFKYWFPTFSVEVDRLMRQAYRGGYTYLKDGYSEENIGPGVVFDVNSLYPSIMFEKPMVYGVPSPFTGKYVPNQFYTCYIQQMYCEFQLKPGHLPTIQDKLTGQNVETDYLTHTERNKPIELVLTNIDLELFFDHYDVTVHEWIGGFMFKAAHGLFDEYIEHWMAVKENNSETKNALYQLAKLMLNNLYGKFGSNPDVKGRYPEIDEAGVLHYKPTETKVKKPIYTPLALFVTSYAREKTIRTAQENYDRFIYADTDSLHLIGTDIPSFEIHPSKLGCWAFENEFTRARFIKQKVYVEEINGELHVKGAGMSDEVKQQITWENFFKNRTFSGNKRTKNVEGGVILSPVDFTIGK
jgi:hypothetical protein